MPPEKGSPGDPREWLRRARSDLALAGIDRPRDVMREALCYHAHQAAEKALKAVLVSRRIPIPHTHSIRMLLDSIPPEIEMPADLEEAAALTAYAVAARYPGDLEPVDEEEHRGAVKLASLVVTWAEGVMVGEA